MTQSLLGIVNINNYSLFRANLNLNYLPNFPLIVYLISYLLLSEWNRKGKLVSSILRFLSGNGHCHLI